MPLYSPSPTPSLSPVDSSPGAGSEDVGSITATWTDPDGGVWPLSDIGDDVGVFTTFAIAGWGAGPHEIVTDPDTRGGETVRYIRPQGARITWPLHIWGSTHLAFVQRYRALRRAFMSTLQRRRPGTLRVAFPDGSAREIDCFYEQGFGGEAGQNWVSASPVLTLYAPTGVWRDTEQITVSRSFAPGVDYLDDYLTVSASDVLGATAIDNPGDVEAWPLWTIDGPATSVTATNHSTGDAFTLTYGLSAGQTITIDTLQPALRGPAGQNLVGSLNWPSAYLWPLLPGNNDVEFAVAGGNVGTRIQLAYNPLYQGV